MTTAAPAAHRRGCMCALCQPPAWHANDSTPPKPTNEVDLTGYVTRATFTETKAAIVASGGEGGTGKSVPLLEHPNGDPVNHPSHYTTTVPDIECIEVTEHFSFLRGNAIKYLWRAGAKGDTVQDLEKARWYINREIDKLRAEA